MQLKRLLVDKFLGSAGVAIGLATLALMLRSAGLIVRGPSAARRLLGVGGIAGGIPTCVAMFYFGITLLRYPSERKSTAAEIARDAMRQGGPLTRRWSEE